MTRREFAFTYAPLEPSAAKVAPLVRGVHPQEAFHEDRYRHRYRALFAGTGSGKTFAAAFEAFAWMLENPRSRGVMSEPDYPMVRRTLIPALEDVLGAPNEEWGNLPIVRTWNRTDHYLRLVNDAEAWLVGLEKPGKVEGMNLDWWWADEIRLVRNWRDAWARIRRRLRGARQGNRIGAWVSTHSPSKEQVEFFEGPNANPSARVYRWSTLDNDRSDRDSLLEIARSHTGRAYQAVVLGEHALAEGLVYSEFDPRRHVQPWTGGRPDVVSYGVDWGWTLPAALSAWAWTGDVAHGVAEVYGSHRTVRELAKEALELEKTWGEGVWWCDASRPEHVTEFREEGLDARAYTGREVDGVGVLNDMLRGDELRVDPVMKHWLQEVESHSFKPGTDVPEDGGEHALDAGRYAIMGHRGAAAYARVW